MSVFRTPPTTPERNRQRIGSEDSESFRQFTVEELCNISSKFNGIIHGSAAVWYYCQKFNIDSGEVNGFGSDIDVVISQAKYPTYSPKTQIINGRSVDIVSPQEISMTYDSPSELPNEKIYYEDDDIYITEATFLRKSYINNVVNGVLTEDKRRKAAVKIELMDKVIEEVQGKKKRKRKEDEGESKTQGRRLRF